MKKSGNTSKVNQNIQVYVRLRPLNLRERHLGSSEVVDVISHKEIITRHNADHKLTKKFTFDRIFDADSKQVDVYTAVVAPLIEEVLAGYNCTVFAYGQTGTGKTHTMVGNECVGLNSSWDDDSEIGIIPRALSHLFDELRMLNLEFSMRISYLELYNEELCDLLSSDDSTKIRIFDDNTKKGSVIIQGLEEIPVHNKDDVYKLLEKGKERRKTATTLMNAQSSRSHTVFSILVHIKENGIDGEEMLKIGKLNLVDLAGSENVSKAGNEKAIRVRETVNINQSLLTLGRVITALVERTPHIPYRESKLTRLLQESLGGRTKTSIIATVSPGHKDIEETLSTLEYAHRAKNIQNKPEVNQKLTKKAVIKEYTEEIDRLKRELMAAREKNGIYLPDETYNEMLLTMDSQNRELNEKILLLKALKDELTNKERIFNEVSLNLVEKTEELIKVSTNLSKVEDTLQQTQRMLYNTKRRYQEKNVVLQSHMKTEEILTRQANEIMQVADTATKHTHALHETIERRKGVDEQIQTACERFSQRMHDHFDSMDANLNDLEKQHNRLTSKFNDELNANIMQQIKHMEDTDTKLKAITTFVETTMKDSCSMTERFTKDFHQIGEEQKEEIMKFLENFKQNELMAMKKIKDDLTGLTNHNLNKKSIIMETCDNFMQILDANNNTCRMNNAKIKDIFKAIEQQTRENLQELQQISANITTEQELLQEERKLIAEFQQNLNVLHAKHDQKTLNTMNSINSLNNSCEISLNTLRKGTKLNETVATEQEKHNELVVNFVREQSNIVSNTFNHNIDEYSNLEKQINEMQQMNNCQLNIIAEHQNIYHDKIQTQHNQYKYDANNLAMKISEDFRTNTSDIRKLLEENYKRMENHDTVMKTLNADGQSALRNYCHTYQEQVAQCAVDVNTFKTNELKTYSATGQTPSKREFKYPRVLATTSPHMRIVKRYRLENDCSDMETTIPIHHEEIDCNDESIIQDNSIPFHSTPSIEPLKTNSNNDLPVHSSAEGYLSTITSSPQKCSSLTTPMIVMTCYNSENKENINQSSNLIDKQQ